MRQGAVATLSTVLNQDESAGCDATHVVDFREIVANPSSTTLYAVVAQAPGAGNTIYAIGVSGTTSVAIYAGQCAAQTYAAGTRLTATYSALTNITMQGTTLWVSDEDGAGDPILRGVPAASGASVSEVVIDGAAIESPPSAAITSWSITGRVSSTSRRLRRRPACASPDKPTV